MARILNYPDFLADPQLSQVGTTLQYNGNSGIGGSFGQTPGDSYMKTLDKALTYQTDFKLIATAIITKLKAGTGIVLGGLDATSGSTTYLQLHGAADDTIDEIVLVMDDGPGAPVTVARTIATINTLVKTVVRIEWVYEIASGFATSRVVLRDASDNVLADVSDNILASYSVNAFGVFTPSTALPEVAPLTDAIFTTLTIDTVLPVSGFEVTPRMVEEELQGIAQREASTFHRILRDGTFDRWVEEVEANTLEFMGFELKADFDAMINTNAEQLARRQLMLRQVILKRVSVRVLEVIDANRTDVMSLGYSVVIGRKTSEANRIVLHLQRLFHPDSAPETVIADKPTASTYPLRPSDPLPDA